MRIRPLKWSDHRLKNFFQKKFEKVLTTVPVYAIIQLFQGKEEREDEIMMNWYENAENHEEDFEALMDLLEYLATECAEE